jgi:hypothetical protein
MSVTRRPENIMEILKRQRVDIQKLKHALARVSAGGAGATDLDGLSDVAITGPLAARDVLVYDGAANFVDRALVELDISDLQAYILDVTGDPLGDLSDVTLTAIGAGELLTWTGSAWINETLAEAGIAATGDLHAESHDVASHSNVTITSIGAGEILEWSGSVWRNQTLGEAGIEALGHLHGATYVELAGDVMTGALRMPDGLVGTPSLTFSDDLNTGTWSPSDDIFAISAGGTEIARFDDNSVGDPFVTLGNGTTGHPKFQLGAITTSPVAPEYTFVGDENTGIYRAGENRIGFATAAVQRFEVNDNGVLFDNDAESLPNSAQVSPANFNPVSASTYETITGSELTVWDHDGDDHLVELRAWGKGIVTASSTTARTVIMRVQYSIDGGSTWVLFSNGNTQSIVKTDGSWQVAIPVIGFVAATATGDVKVRLQAWRNGVISGFSQISLMATVNGVF